ncbi:MAG TPA: T9SS type A sorting domain-containing protein [Chitinophagales bacterium]|nr:T9SS type A sorting domain-containing protein [Chitinophagales bacterium]
MKKKLSLLILLTLTTTANSFGQTWSWAKSAGGTPFDWASSVTSDASGDIIAVGSYLSPTITFGSITLLNTNGFADMFILKYDSAGNVLWAKTYGGSYYDYPFCVTADASGNIIVAGDFDSPTITFGSTTLTSVGSGDMFIVKYDAAGNVLWAKSAGGADDYDHARSVTTDSLGNIIAVGYFKSADITFGSTTLLNVSNNNLEDIFIVKYDAAGNVLWAKSAGGNYGDAAYSVTADAAGNIIAAGIFYSTTLTFGSTTLTNANAGNYDDIFIVKYDSAGNVLWAKSAGGIANDVAYAVTTDPSGNIIAAGYFLSASITFDSSTFLNAGGSDMFIVKYDTAGNVLWAKSAGGTSNDGAIAITTDASGNIIATGSFYGTITFGSTTLSSAGEADIFIVKYDTAGNVTWANSAGGIGYDSPSSITADASGNIIAAGDFASSTLTFGSTTLTNAGGYDMFVAKLGTILSTGINDIPASRSTTGIFPNPFSGSTTISFSLEQSQNVSLRIFDMNGRLVTTLADAYFEEGDHEIVWNTENLNPGIYFLRFQSAENSETVRLAVTN